MKWFKHFCDAYTNIKHQELMSEHSLEGYGFFWIVVELVGQQGKRFSIDTKKPWKKVLLHITNLKEEKIDALLKKLADTGLISKEALNKGILSIPKMKEYADDYTERKLRKSTNTVRTLSEHSTNTVRTKSDFVPLDKIRLDKNTNTNVLVQDKPAAFGNPVINKFIDLLKAEFRLTALDGSQFYNRKYCSLALKKFGEDALEAMIKAGAQDKFWATNVTSFRDIYYKGVKIAAQKDAAPKAKKPYFQDQLMVQFDKRWYVMTGGERLEFNGNEKDIEWK